MIIFNALLLALAPASAFTTQSSDTQIDNATLAKEEDPQYFGDLSPKDILTAYREAIQELDASKMKSLF